jgi:hypothetical protein
MAVAHLLVATAAVLWPVFDCAKRARSAAVGFRHLAACEEKPDMGEAAQKQSRLHRRWLHELAVCAQTVL